MTNIPGINVPGTIVPFTDTDTYPTHDPQYGIGGWREVATTAARDAIPASRLRAGMVVFVQGDQPYLYTGTDWTPLSLGGGGGGGSSFPDSISVIASTNLTAGQLVSLFQDVDTIVKARPSDSSVDFNVTGYVNANVTSGQTASVKLQGVFTTTNTNVTTADVGSALYLDQNAPGGIDNGGSDASLYQKIGTLISYNAGTNMATVLFNAGGLTNADLDSLQILKVSEKDQPNGVVGLDSNTRILDLELNKSYTTTTDLTSSGSTRSMALNGSDVYVFTGTPATAVAISLTLPSGLSAGEFTIQNDSSKDISVQAGVSLGNLFIVPSKGSQKFYYPTGVGLVASSNIKDGKRFYQTSTNLNISADGIMPGQRVVVIGNAGASDITVTLPIASSVPGTTVLAAKADSGAGKVLLQPNVSDFIGKSGSNGSAFNKLAAQFDSVIIASDGSDWQILSGVPFTAPTHQFLTKYNPSGDIQSAQPAASDLSNGTTGSGLVALNSSPSLAGVPTAPTAAVDTNTTQLATTAFVLGQASAVGDGTPVVDGTASRGTSAHYARADHVHPTDTSRQASLTNQGTTSQVLHGNAAGSPAFSAVIEGDISLSDVTTNNVSTTKHGFVPKAPNDATKFLNGTGAFTTPPATGATANSTTGSIPYLSAASTFSDSPLFREDANTISQRNSTVNQTLNIYSSFTDAANNEGVRLVTGVSDTLETFKNGTGTARDLNINAPSSQLLRLQVAGSTKMRFSSAQGVELLVGVQSVAGVSTSGAMGVPTIVAYNQLDGHNDASRTDHVFGPGAGFGPGSGGLYRWNYAFIVHTTQATTMTSTFTWVDRNTNSHSIVITLDLSVITNETHGSIIMDVKGASSIDFATVIAGGGAAGAYDLKSCLEQLA